MSQGNRHMGVNRKKTGNELNAASIILNAPTQHFIHAEKTKHVCARNDCIDKSKIDYSSLAKSQY